MLNRSLIHSLRYTSKLAHHLRHKHATQPHGNTHVGSIWGNYSYLGCHPKRADETLKALLEPSVSHKIFPVIPSAAHLHPLISTSTMSSMAKKAENTNVLRHQKPPVSPHVPVSLVLIHRPCGWFAHKRATGPGPPSSRPTVGVFHSVPRRRCRAWYPSDGHSAASEKPRWICSEVFGCRVSGDCFVPRM